MVLQCSDVVTFVMVAVLLIGEANGSDDSTICYKPPLPTNTSSAYHDLFDLDANLEFPVGVVVPSCLTNLSISIVGSYSINVSISYLINLLLLSNVYVECSYMNATTPKQTPLPTIRLDLFSDTNAPTKVGIHLSFDHIVESDGILLLICKFWIPPEDGGVGFINGHVSLKLQGCPHARYDVHCDKPCSCASGVECHPFTGECICPRGLQGETCSRVQPMLSLEGPVFVNYGKAVTLTCTAYGMVPMQWRWYHGSLKLQTRNSTDDVLYYPRPFHVSTTINASLASIEVNGVYTCSIVNNNELYHREVTVIVTDIPNPFLEAPSNHSIILGNSVELRCRTKPEAGTLTWMKGNQIYIQPSLDWKSNQTIGQSLMDGERNQTSSIIIEHVVFEDAGRYRCIVGHEGANDSAITDAWLTVESQGTRPYITTSVQSVIPRGILKVLEGTVHTLMCRVHEAYPKPSISWFIGEVNHTKDAKVQSRTSSNGVSYDVDSTLTFRPTWRNDGKRLRCVSNVLNFQPNSSRDILLNISYAPKVTISPQEKTVQPGDSPIFKCIAPANPSVTGYRWTLRRKNGTIVKNYTGRSVTVHSVDSRHNMATLTCYATNNVGPNNSKAVIKVFDKPDDEPSEFHLALMIAALSILAVLMVIIPIMIYKHRGKIQDLFFRNKRHQILENKTHDVFVAYKGGGEEEAFVINSLVPRLKDWGCDVCVHYENFLPGRVITENITAAVSSSRKTLLVLSPDFMVSEWCYFEFLCAMGEMLRNQTNFIIPLMFEDVRNKELCQSMQNLLDTVSFIPWPVEGAACLGHTDEFWKLLKRAVDTKFNVNRNEDV